MSLKWLDFSLSVHFYTRLPATLTLQRYLMKDLVKAPFPVREIGTVMTLLHAGHVP